MIDNTGVEKSKKHCVVDLIEYVSNAVVRRTILKKITGDSTAFSLDKGQELDKKTIPFDTFILIIDGVAQVTAKGKKYEVSVGEGIVIPAHDSHSFQANRQFKMIATVIKNGYDD